MTALPSVSVVIVSRDRPRALRRAVLGVSQLYYPNFELVVVADPSGVAALGDLSVAQQAKIVSFDQPNISAARNVGLAQAAGEIVAFLDDDAVPEPSWLDHLAAPFASRDVNAATGFVRGRNGISWQWRASMVNGTGDTREVSIKGDDPTTLIPESGWVPKTEGTNMAFRRDALLNAGGFDPRYAFFLDETDLNLRLATPTVIVPLAQVHHGFCASPRRRADRVPRDLFDIGASWAVFLGTHCQTRRRQEAWEARRRAEWTRAVTHMVRGGLEPRDVRRLMKRLDQGFADGHGRPRRSDGADLRSHAAAAPSFRRFPTTCANGDVHSGLSFRANALDDAARQSLKAGRTATILRFSLTTLYHHMRFTDAGYWLQTGGLYGRSVRSEPLVQFQRAIPRFDKEAKRMEKFGRFTARYINHK